MTFGRSIGTVLVAATVAGCAPARLLENPPEWPARWADRQLFTTPEGFIYAGSAAAAGEADALLRHVVSDFRNQTGGEPTRGLLIVTDADDAPFVQDVRLLYWLAQHSKTFARGQPVPSDTDLEAARKTIEEAASELGVSADTMLRMSAVSLSPEQYDAVLSFPDGVPDGTHWAVAAPTRAVVRRCNHKIVQAALKESGVNIGLQVLLAPILAMVESTSENATAAVRDVTIFARLAFSQPGWSAERIAAETQSYAEKCIREAMGPLLDLAASNEVTTEPGFTFDVNVGPDPDAADAPVPPPQSQPAASPEAPVPETASALPST